MRRFVRVILIVAIGALSVGAALTAWSLLGLRDGATWSTIAAALAVITSLIVVWNGQRGIELQEDALRPYPYPFIDASSRPQLLQLRMTNFGGTAAYDVYLECRDGPIDFTGKAVSFSSQSEAPEVAVLLPGHSIATPIDSDTKFFQRCEDANYRGKVLFKNASGQNMQHDFYVSAEQYRHATGYEEEEPRTQYELQKIPKEIENLTRELRLLRASLKLGNNE